MSKLIYTESSATRPPLEVRLAGKYPFIDKVQVWIPKPLNPVRHWKLKQLCGGDVHVHYRSMKFQPRWRQRLQLNQPTDSAFEYLDRITKGCNLVNGIEIALDLIVESLDDAE